MGWLDRMLAFGNGPHTEITAQQALDIARQAEPRAIVDEHRQHPKIGALVNIAPDDYGQVATAGTLVGCTPDRWIIARQDKAVGTVHVHFPKQGFVLS